MAIKIINTYRDVLTCPGCGGDYIHHYQVDTYSRHEDGSVGHHVQASVSAVKLDNDLSGNPSTRRHGLSILFWCEYCDDISKMTIAQHKGSTEIAFEVVGKFEGTPEEKFNLGR